jgi:hypothetical protein
MRGAITPLHQYVFVAWCLVKDRDFTFYLKDMGSDFVGWNHLAQHRVQWRVLIAVMNFRVS